MKPKVEWLEIPKSGFISIEFHSPEWVWMTGDEIDKMEKKLKVYDLSEGVQLCLFEATSYMAES